jgi:hypothetical protein
MERLPGFSVFLGTFYFTGRLNHGFSYLILQSLFGVALKLVKVENDLTQCEMKTYSRTEGGSVPHPYKVNNICALLHSFFSFSLS